jgi:DNA-directed RNA polymerase specialized sigma24 family protein
MEAIVILQDAALEREKLFISLYKKVFPAAAKYIARRGGDFDDAKDVFQDAVAVYYEKVVTDPDAVPATPQAYIMGVVKHLWSRRFNDSLKNIPLDGNLNDNEEENEQTLLFDKLNTLMATAGARCMQLLKAFYYDKLPIKGLANAFGYHTEHSATVQKYKCLEKLRTEVKQRALHYEDFIE